MENLFSKLTFAVYGARVNPKIAISQAFLFLLSTLCVGLLFYKTGTLNSNSSKPSSSDNSSVASVAGVDRVEKTDDVSEIVTKALAFKALLTTTQQSSLQLTYTTTLARKWSNLPCGASCRNGIQFGSLNSAQLAAALAVIKATLGTSSNDGYDEFMQNRLAEAYLHANGGGNGYDSTLRWIAFLNTPSSTGAWMLQFGGHHYAANIAFNNGHVIGATPFFQGLEPLSFTWNGTTYASLDDEHSALTAMLASLTTSQLATAQLTTSFSDITMCPGESNGGTGTFPSTKVGIACSNLSSTQKNLVIAAIGHYVNDMDATTAAVVLQRYTDEIDGTYIAYTGNGTSGNASSFLSSNSNYVRIDGPTVWIELSCQNGVVISGQIHYHTIWRDHDHDYGVDLSGDAIDENETTSIQENIKKTSLEIYPNPTSDIITFSPAVNVKNAKIELINMGTGQTIVIANQYSGSVFQHDISTFAAGTYVVRITDASGIFTGKFVKK